MNAIRGRGSAVARAFVGKESAFDVGRGSASALPFRTAWLAAALVALASAPTAGCSNVCDDAVDHLDECGYDDGDRYGGASCEGEVACASECYVNTSCGAFDGTDAAARTDWLKCLEGC
jgi:hypothetical protein